MISILYSIVTYTYLIGINVLTIDYNILILYILILKHMCTFNNYKYNFN